MGKSQIKRLVISAVNFTEGGPLTILKDAVKTARHSLGEEWNITILVHNKDLIEDDVTLIEFPKCKSSWFLRLWHEWWVFRKISKSMDVDLWFSLHDITPPVFSRRQSVYCHNPAPFYRMSISQILLDPKMYIFTKIYIWIYRLCIKRNQYVIVQQSWLRSELKKYIDFERIVVAWPNISENEIKPGGNALKGDKIVYFYPALPRVFKNHEVIFRASEKLAVEYGEKYEIRVTISGTENRYAKWLHKKFGNSPQIKFLGRLDKNEMHDEYLRATVVVFPSNLETWGLPISEAKIHNIPLLISNLPYAHETVGEYSNVRFFNPDDSDSLASEMKEVILGNWRPLKVNAPRVEKPYSRNWTETWNILTKGL